MVSALYCYLLPIYAFQMLNAVLQVCHLSLTIIRSKNPSVFTSYHTLQLLYYLIVLFEHCQCIIEYKYCLEYIITFNLELHQCFSPMGSTLVRHFRPWDFLPPAFHEKARGSFSKNLVKTIKQIWESHNDAITLLNKFLNFTHIHIFKI